MSSNVVSDALKRNGYELTKRATISSKKGKYYITETTPKKNPTDKFSQQRFLVEQACNDVNVYFVRKRKKSGYLGDMTSTEKQGVMNVSEILYNKGYRGKELRMAKIAALRELRKQRIENRDKIINKAIKDTISEMLSN